MKYDKHKPMDTISSNNYDDEPEDSFDLVNKYGTYNIQPTSNTVNSFPKIAHGLAKRKYRKIK